MSLNHSLYSLLLLTTLFSISTTTSNHHLLIRQVSNNNDHITQFEEFKTKYNKKYQTEEENEYRFGVFISNLVRAALHNKLDPLATHGVTKFSDLTPQEFNRKLASPGFLPITIQDAPTLQTNNLSASMDWRDLGAVTHVKDEASCYASWAISVAGLLEARRKITQGSLVDLSVQQLLDCDNNCVPLTTQCDNGCDGGNTYTALDYLLKVGGLMSNEDYPYTATDGNPCEFDRTKVVQSVSKIYYIPYTEHQIAAYVAKRNPVVVNVNARFLHTYTGGVYCPSQCKRAGNHGALLVGYDSGGNWIVKNSWGSNWGEKGYFTLCKNFTTCQDQVDPIALTIE